MSRMVAQPAADPRAAIRDEARRVAATPGADIQAIFRLGAAALQHGMPAEADAMFALAVRVLHHFIERRDAPNALAIEALLYNTFVKAVESEEHYERAFSQWREAMSALGRSFAREPESRPAPAGEPGIGFVFHTGTVLGHTEVLFRLLGARDAKARERGAVRIYTLFGADGAFEQGAAALGVPVESYAREPGGPQEWLRNRMAGNGDRVAVWVSAPPAALFVFGARVAPVQVFWSLKHHPVRAPEIDGYLTYGSWGETERVFHGQRWTVCPVPLALDPRPRPAEAVAAVRAQFPQKVLAGTLAREEKIASRPFLESVAAILKRPPQVGWLWTGRTRHAGVHDFFRAQGVGDRVHHVGWVDTPLYAAALDLFLETFPLGCGITGYQAMGAGVPLLSYADANTVFGMQYWEELGGGRRPIERAALDRYPVLVARDPAEYVELASRLIDDPAFRAGWREREQRFHDEEIADIGRYSRRFFDSIAAIAAAKGRP
jgi:hypothetical protein